MKKYFFIVLVFFLGFLKPAFCEETCDLGGSVKSTPTWNCCFVAGVTKFDISSDTGCTWSLYVDGFSQPRDYGTLKSGETKTDIDVPCGCCWLGGHGWHVEVEGRAHIHMHGC